MHVCARVYLIRCLRPVTRHSDKFITTPTLTQNVWMELVRNTMALFMTETTLTLFSALGVESLLGGNSCLQSYPQQQFRMASGGRISQDDFCLTLSEVKTGAAAVMALCDPNSKLQRWTRLRVKKSKGQLRGYQIKHAAHDLCLDVSAIKSRGLLAFRCEASAPTQRFSWTISLNR